MLLIVGLIVTCAQTFAQSFPQIWDIGQYDFQKGEKGMLKIINYSGSYAPIPNKAIIFATGVTEGSTSNVTRDLFRLTLEGTSTLNSPFSGYDVKLQFANRQTVMGAISGTESTLKIYGNDGVNIGTRSYPSLLSIASDNVIFGKPIKYVGILDNINFQIGMFGNQRMVGLQTLNSVPIGIGGETYPGLIIDDSQNVFAGMTFDDYQRVTDALKRKFSLFVKEGILSEDYAIAPISSWADYVFEEQYKLRPLLEVENFIKKNKHLPDVPSAAKIAEDGYSQHEMNKILLSKIEELTLYILNQQKEIEELKIQLNNR